MRESHELVDLPEPLKWWTRRSVTFIIAVGAFVLLHDFADSPVPLVVSSIVSYATCCGFAIWCAFKTAHTTSIRIQKGSCFVIGAAVLITSIHVFFYLLHDLYYLHRVVPSLMRSNLMFRAFVAYPEMTQVLSILTGLISAVWLVYLMSVVEIGARTFHSTK
ncbi:MAG: hypothetical protein JWM11_2765 [Planctomycetaceae bacterium]|nr:hypothetical protein [Planctomycetaceae bacterium]